MAAFSHAESLSLLARGRPAEIKALAEYLLEFVQPVEVLKSRTGLVMLPIRDSVEGVNFYLGEVLVGEAHIRLGDGTEGYGAVAGHDLEHAMAMAVVDGAALAGYGQEAIQRYMQNESERQATDERTLMLKVEATRIEGEGDV